MTLCYCVIDCTTRVACEAGEKQISKAHCLLPRQQKFHQHRCPSTRSSRTSAPRKLPHPTSFSIPSPEQLLILSLFFGSTSPVAIGNIINTRRLLPRDLYNCELATTKQRKPIAYSFSLSPSPPRRAKSFPLPIATTENPPHPTSPRDAIHTAG